MRFPTTLLLALLFSGCTGRSTDSLAAPPAPDARVGIDLVGQPLIFVGTNGTQIAWNLDARANGTRGAQVAIELMVTYARQHRDAGGDHADVLVPDEGNATFTLRSSYIGFGDYYYDITARDATGRVAGEIHGMWERCPGAPQLGGNLPASPSCAIVRTGMFLDET